MSSTMENLSKRKKNNDHYEFHKDIDNEHIQAYDPKLRNEIDQPEFMIKKSKLELEKKKLEKLREFQVLDEVNDEVNKDEDTDASDKSELSEGEIEKMLEEDLPDGFKGTKMKEKSYVTGQKTVLEEKGINHLEVLPLDWIIIRHCSGMPVYMHRGTRVCTLSKPYFLGKGNTRRHDIPLSAIPCLSYRKALEEEEKQKEIDRNITKQIANGTWEASQQNYPQVGPENEDLVNNVNDLHHVNPYSNNSNMDSQLINFGNDIDDEESTKQTQDSANNGNADLNQSSCEPEENGKAGLTNSYGESKCPMKDSVKKPVVLPGGIVMPPPRVESADTSWKTQHLAPEQLNDYCKKLFKFKNVEVIHFKRWADRRKYVKARKILQYPTLPEGTKFITIPAQNQNGSENSGKAMKRDWVMNMNGSSYLSVFHEYVKRALQKKPIYEFRHLEKAATPYQATVFIDGMQYGVGHGSSKRQAKSAAAKAAMHILIPQLEDLDCHAPSTSKETTSKVDPDYSFFDNVGIEDPRIAEFCASTSEPSPRAILKTCLLRNFDAGERHVTTEMKKLEYQKIELTMRVGKHSATVVCKNKKQARQLASQAILQVMHPYIKSWGSLLRLYGSRSVKSSKEKKLEEQEITLLQGKAQQNEPNHAVLEKLRHEMNKLKQRDEAIVPIGELLANQLPTHSGSMLNYVDL